MKTITAVILAGGLGKRLQPLTSLTPKPLLPIGESSVLEIQIRSLARNGVTNIIVATYYMSEHVEEKLGNGSRYGVEISISKEDKPLGTCGPLSLLRDRLQHPFLLINGDILTTCRFSDVYGRGLQIDSDLTVVTTEIVTPFDFGNVISEGDFLLGMEEKPDLRMEVLAGIYFMKPEVLNRIPDDTYFGIDDLIKRMLAEKKAVGRYLMKEYWLDVGRMDDYEEARNNYGRFLAETGETGQS